MKKKRNNDSKKSALYFLARYSGLAFEMLGIIFLGTFAGHKIDEHRQAEFPLWTLILSLFSIASALYLVIRGLMQNDS